MNDIEKKDIENKIESTERREVLASLLKYTAVVGGASTVVLSASEAVAKSSASGGKPHCDPKDKKKYYRKKKKKYLRKKKKYLQSKKKRYGNFW